MKRIFALREEEGTRASFKISSLSALKPTLSSAWHLTPFVGILAQLCRRLLLKCSKSGFLFVKLKCNIYEFLTLLRVFPLHFLGNQLQLHFHFSKHNFTFDIYFWIFKDFFQTLCIFWFVFFVKSILEFHYEEGLYRVFQQVLDRNFTKKFLCDKRQKDRESLFTF